MQTEKFVIANLKCSGCAHTIKSKILELQGVKMVDVNLEEDTVTVSFELPTNRPAINSKLYSLGYPEATEENGLLLQVKSYASCMIGRISK
ncbi:MAG: heavy metal-associated domain-containing protein [Chitinophagales bacterium]